MALESRYVSADLERRANYTYRNEKESENVYLLSRSSRLNAEVHPMLKYNSSNYDTTENNNNNNNVKNGKSPLHKEETAVQYSSNAKGVLAQVRY